MKKYVIINTLSLLLVLISCNTRIAEIKQSEKRDDIGLLIINRDMMSSLFYGVNKRKSKVLYEMDPQIYDDRNLYSFNKISKPIKSLPKIKLSEEGGKLWYVWVKIKYHAKEDIKGLESRKGWSDFAYKYKIYELTSEVEIDDIEPIDPQESKIYHQTLDSLFQAKAGNVLYGPFKNDSEGNCLIPQNCDS